ncbi:SAVMC3_10250 family protein [Amycolatopsis sp. Poz14]|uniref:SAVMC3_10250 family protein n=1 Tax=Amycolatopsis sp. Poz14 TaxID=1447705 RepID=UPI001EE84638|nr:SAVMC3_10250 family protein [Amycolatopsis sp. Poz14]MCG3752733.1 hypothetical protein [Amycolatopsis sp. Poz14]
MRELVYVSEAKLSQFESQGLNKHLARASEVAGKVPGVELRVNLSGRAAHPGLDRAVRKIGTSARWYTDDELVPGQWVQFEARLNYRVVHGGSHGGQSAALLFWEPANGDEPRLLLHGSPEHLVGTRKTPPAETIGLPISHSGGMADFLDELTGKSFSQALHFLLGDLDRRTPPELAGWMAGYARLTADLAVTNTPAHFTREERTPPTRVVLASPLYVEYTSAPEPG